MESDVQVANATPIASDAPTTSITLIAALWRNSPRTTVSENSAPDDEIVRSDEMSHRSGSASSASTSGLANASPTIASEVTRRRVIVSSTSTAVKPAPVSVMTDPPLFSTGNARTDAAACMSGDAMSATGPGCAISGATAARSASSGNGTAARPFNTRSKSSCRHITPFGAPVVPPV